MNSSRAEKRLEITLFLVLFLSFAYFYQGGGANQNARLDQIRSIVELGQLNLKPFTGTHDIVRVKNKTYPNKAPGISLLGVVPYYLVSRLKPIVVSRFSEDFYHLLSCYLVTVAVAAIPCAFGGVVFFRLLGLFHAGIWPRLICTLGLFLGTPAFAYSTVIYGHMVSSVLTVVSFYLLYKYLCVRPDAPRASLFIFLAGLSGGAAVLTEYPAILIVFATSLYCLIYAFSKHSERRLLSCIFLFLSLSLLSLAAVLFIKFNLLVLFPGLFGRLSEGKVLATNRSTAIFIAWICLFCSLLSLTSFISACYLSGRSLTRFLWFLSGLLFPAAILLIYNKLVFGSPLYIAYFDTRAAAHSAYRKGPLLGFNSQQLIKALYQTSFGPFRGFFHLSPFLILIFPGIFYFAREKGKRGLLITLWLMAIIYFLLNTIYPYWYGGKALGPRHAMEILPYLCLLAFFFIVRFPRLSSLLVAVSVFFMLSATSVRPEEYARLPFRSLYFPAFTSGNLSLNHETTFQKNTVVSPDFNSFNLGEIAGMEGQISLLPIYLIWLTGGLLMTVFARKEEKNPAGRGFSPLGEKVALVLLGLVLVLQIINLVYQMQLKVYLDDLSEAGTYQVPPDQVPVAEGRARTSPGHRLQVWEVLKPFAPGDTVKIKLQHAAKGRNGGFYIMAYGDENRDGKPDVELGRSPFLTAKKAGDWSFWPVPAPEGKLFVGNAWNEGAWVFFDRAGWKNQDLSSLMFYSSGGPPLNSTRPRSTNLVLEIVKEEPETEGEEK